MILLGFWFLATLRLFSIDTYWKVRNSWQRAYRIQRAAMLLIKRSGEERRSFRHKVLRATFKSSLFFETMLWNPWIRWKYQRKRKHVAFVLENLIRYIICKPLTRGMYALGQALKISKCTEKSSSSLLKLTEEKWLVMAVLDVINFHKSVGTSNCKNILFSVQATRNMRCHVTAATNKNDLFVFIKGTIEE